MAMKKFGCAVIGAVFALSLFGSAAQAADDSLVLYLPFDEGAGDKVADLSGKGNDGTIQGASWVAGKMGKALDFDGTTWVEIPHSASLEPDKTITVMAWVNPRKDATGELMIVSKGSWKANDMPYELSVEAGKVVFWQFYDTAGHDQCNAPAPAGGEWHHFAGTYDGSTFKLYFDGAEVKTFDFKAEKLPKNGAKVVIGRRSTAVETFFKGMIDEVAIYNRALTAEEVKSATTGVVPAAVEPVGKLAATWGAMKARN